MRSLKLLAILAYAGQLFAQEPVDFECFAPFDELHQNYAFYAGISNGVESFEVNNAIIGSVAGHSLLSKCIDRLRLTLKIPVKKDTYSDLINYVVATSGPVFFSRCQNRLRCITG